MSKAENKEIKMRTKKEREELIRATKGRVNKEPDVMDKCRGDVSMGWYYTMCARIELEKAESTEEGKLRIFYIKSARELLEKAEESLRSENKPNEPHTPNEGTPAGLVKYL